MEPWVEDLTKLLIAVAVGGLIGLERELSDKPAGFRTMILICVGAALYTIFSVRIAGESKDPGRIAAQIVTGVGFLGAGAILRDRRTVMGLTTAAAIWLVASLGVGVGLAQYRTVLPAAGIILLVLFAFQRLEHWLDRRRDDHAYDLHVKGAAPELQRVQALIAASGLTLFDVKLGKDSQGTKLCFRAIGQEAVHRQFTDRLLVEDAVGAFERD